MKFQNPSLNSVLNGRTDKRTNTQAEYKYAPHFFKVGGIISDTLCILILLTPKATAWKRNELTRGTSLDRVDSELVKRLIN